MHSCPHFSMIQHLTLSFIQIQCFLKFVLIKIFFVYPSDKTTNEFFFAVRFVLAATVFSRINIIASSSLACEECRHAGCYAVGYFLPRLDCYVSRYASHNNSGAFRGAAVLHEKLIGSLV